MVFKVERTFGNSNLPQTLAPVASAGVNADEHRFLDEQVRFGIFKSEKDTLRRLSVCIRVYLCSSVANPGIAECSQ